MRRLLFPLTLGAVVAGLALAIRIYETVTGTPLPF